MSKMVYVDVKDEAGGETVAASLRAAGLRGVKHDLDLRLVTARSEELTRDAVYGLMSMAAINAAWSVEVRDLQAPSLKPKAARR